MSLIHDIKEKDITSANPPSFPKPQPGTTGYPQHKKRTSAFRQQRQGAVQSASAAGLNSQNDATIVSSPPQHAATSRNAAMARVPTSADNERQRIDQENREMLDNMSPEQIAHEQEELLDNLDPRLAQLLLRRANLDTKNPVFDAPEEESRRSRPMPTEESAPKITIHDTTASETEHDTLPTSQSVPMSTPTTTISTQSPDPTTQQPPLPLPPPNTTHFPQPPTLPDLDPSSPSFLTALHEKYFPSLPADPSKLAWMSPLPTEHSPADRDSPYYPNQSSIALSALRFDFNGRLVSPSESRKIPVSKGLHHHGEAPEAAGYTIPELGRLARSAVPAQRCVAFQLLGRVMYRLGRGEWGSPHAKVPKDGVRNTIPATPAVDTGAVGQQTVNSGSEFALGIWGQFEANRVVDSLLEAAGVPEGSGHRGSRAYATEALWLLEKGGWKDKIRVDGEGIM